MSDDLNPMLVRLSAIPVAAPDALEASVLNTIAARREEARRTRALAPVRILSLGFAMVLGVAAGGLAAAQAMALPRQLNTFSAAPHLAPSSLLEGRG